MQTETQKMLDSIFTTSTGIHMLDSGMAYGRAWQRNQARIEKLGTLFNTPKQWLSLEYGDLCPRLSTIHCLDDTLTYDSKLDEAYAKFDSEHPGDSYHDTLEAWVESQKDVFLNEDDYVEFSTYDGYSCDQDIYVRGMVNEGARHKGRPYDAPLCALQVHGGYDIRGGWTRFYIFEGHLENLVAEMSHAYFSCDCTQVDVGMYDGGEVEWEWTNGQRQLSDEYAPGFPCHWKDSDPVKCRICGAYINSWEQPRKAELPPMQTTIA